MNDDTILRRMNSQASLFSSTRNYFISLEELDLFPINPYIAYSIETTHPKFGYQTYVKLTSFH